MTVGLRESGAEREGERPLLPRPLSRHTFKIDAPLLGYRASVARAFDPRYTSYKKIVRVLADVAGVPYELQKTDSAEVWVRVFWAKKARVDLSNILKAVEDGLFKQDRQVVAIHAKAEVNAGMEYAEVDVVVERRVTA